jgi:DNA-binding NarL/FixJ family response regulator
MADPATPLVGRMAELELVERMLDGTSAGEARFLFVSGEPGIGKTRLLSELLLRAADRGYLALHGNAAEFERELPFGLVVNALDEFLESLGGGAFAAHATEDVAELAGVFPALRSLDPGSEEPTTAAERFRAHRAVRALLEGLAEQQPVVLALDDLHWADGASRELISYLLRRPPRAPVLVAASYRRGQAERALVSAIERGLREPDERIELRPLPRVDAQALVGGGETARFARLYDASGGNPFYLLELARMGADPRDGPTLEGREVPEAVAGATVEELEGLSGAGRSLAEGAAVAGDPFELDLAAASADMTEPNALDALDELIDRDLVRPTRVPRRFRFRHPLVRRAIYESSSVGSRIAAHGRSAKALEARGAPVTVRAHHVEHSSQPGDEVAVAVLSEAGATAARRAPASAARWFAAALDLLPDVAPRAERVNLLVALAGSQAATGRFEESRAALLDAIELAGDPDLRVRLIGACAGVEQLLGRHEEARARLTDALGGVADASSAQAVTLMLHLADGDFYRMDYVGMRDWGERALVVAERLEQPLAAASLAVLAVAACFTGAPSEADAFTSTAAVLADTLDDDELEGHLGALTNLSAAELYLHRYDAAERHASRGLAIATASGQGEVVPFLKPVLATVLLHTGRVSQAALIADEVIDAARLSGNLESLAWNLNTRAFVGAMAGDLELAVRLAEESVGVTGDLDDRLIGTYARWGLAAALLEKGEAERATEALLAAAAGAELRRIPESWRAHYLELLTRCRLALGDPAAAECAVARGRAAADRVQCRAATAMAERAAAALLLARGDAEGAARRALTAATVGGAAGARVDAARSRTLAGRALAAVGERERALTELEEAARELETCEARRFRAEAEHELRRLGRRFSRHTRPRDPDAEGVDTLTERELEVARLVVDRHTNPQIARELVLSEKTVETHMRNIFRKLGLSSRADVARAVERAEHLV